MWVEVGNNVLRLESDELCKVYVIDYYRLLICIKYIKEINKWGFISGLVSGSDCPKLKPKITYL